NGVVDVCDAFNNQVVRFNFSTGAYMGAFAQGYSGFGWGVAMDLNVVAYVADDTNGVVNRFNNETGAYMGEIGRGSLINPTFLTVVPIPAPVTGNVILQNYTASAVAGTPVTIVLRNPGSTTALETHTVTLDASGNYSFTTNLLPGTYDIAAKASHWLRQRLANQTMLGSGMTGVNFSLINGDVDGNNTISLSDFGKLKLAYGSTSASSNWNPNADLNGNGTVSLSDFGILKLNYGKAGDP
ncbi:MAG TPA: dockerin type I domain-containing protein, partial [Fimbriimonadaceae bacterium]|nr:dockerin type I domain-containing protein [Fimbriimonadaceae bacterium]